MVEMVYKPFLIKLLGGLSKVYCAVFTTICVLYASIQQYQQVVLSLLHGTNDAIKWTLATRRKSTNYKE